jgi:proline dehydrogenase
MLRSSLIYLSKASWAKNMITNWEFAWRAASRFIAGESLEQGIQAIKQLNQKGILATLDHLGEHTTNEDESQSATQAIIEAIEAIHTSGVMANVSIKLTQIGFSLGTDICEYNLRRLLAHARDRNTFVRIDMEDSSCVDQTLGIYRKMKFDEDFENLGVVIQAYLYRSEADVEQINSKSGKVRLCKGAYKEPADIAYPKKSDVDINFDHLAKMLIDSSLAAGAPEISDDGRIPPIPAIASHDPVRMAYAKGYALQVELPKKAIEFQMLYGIRRDLQEQTAKEGYPVRVYVPYGTQWYPYFVRRLAERPANVWFFISNFFHK